jgi:hypothetical protein
LATAGFNEQCGLALGFGPFTLFGREILPRSAGLKIEQRLQSIANSGAPILRSIGSQYLVLAKKLDASEPSRHVERNKALPVFRSAAE